MKKLFLLSMAAVAMLASCSNDEMVEQQAEGIAIGFDAFVDNGTRSVDPSFNNENNKPAFNVWGWANDVQIFNGEGVSNVGEYTNTQYWVSNTTYKFLAIAPQKITPSITAAAEESSYPSAAISFTNDGVTDLVYAYENRTVATELPTEKVGFTFSHALAKVKVSFKNELSSPVSRLEITDLSINVDKAATAAISKTGNASSVVWSGLSENVDLTLGVAGSTSATAADAIEQNDTESSYYERLVIPNNTANYTISFKVRVYTVGTDGTTQVELGTKKHTCTVSSQNIQAGYAYNFLATLNDQNVLSGSGEGTGEGAGEGGAISQIEFEVTGVDGWEKTNPEDTEVNVE